MTDSTEIQTILNQRFVQLPKVVQDAITSSDIQKHLRELAETNKLHLDQWERLENEVIMTLYGVTPMGQLQKNIQREVGVSEDIAKSLTADISKIVFEPIRGELERSLDNPDAQKKELSGVEQVSAAAIAAEKAASPAPVAVPVAPVAPATPPGAPNTDKVARAPISESYKAGEPSTARKSVHDDPYREPPA